MVSITSEYGLYLYTGKLYGRKSEKSDRLNKRRDDDDRDRGKDNFDGTSGSEKGAEAEGDTSKSGDARCAQGESGDTMKALQKKILRTHPGSEMKVEHIDYSKASVYTDSPTYHRFEDYYSLPEGAYYVTRNGEIDKSYVKVILLTPATIEEHIYETATVRFSDEEDIRTLDTIPPVDRPIKGCCSGTETLCYILTEKFWYNTPFERIVRKLRSLGLRMSKSTLGDNLKPYGMISLPNTAVVSDLATVAIMDTLYYIIAAYSCNLCIKVITLKAEPKSLQ